MFDAIRSACVSLVEQYDDFWLLAALSDWSYEEGIRGGRNKGFARAVDSYQRVGIPAPVIQQLRAGINGNLGAVLRSQNMEVQCNPDCGPDLRIVSPELTPDRALVEVKLLYDCTLHKYYANVAEDRSRLSNWKSPQIECVQAVFFTQLPSFRYPAGRWYGDNKAAPARKTNCLGIPPQFRRLMDVMPFKPTWPESCVHVHELKFPTSVVTEDLLLRRYEQIFESTYRWNFNAAEQLKHAQVGVALWRIE